MKYSQQKHPVRKRRSGARVGQESLAGRLRVRAVVRELGAQLVHRPLEDGRVHALLGQTFCQKAHALLHSLLAGLALHALGALVHKLKYLSAHGSPHFPAQSLVRPQDVIAHGYYKLYHLLVKRRLPGEQLGLLERFSSQGCTFLKIPGEAVLMVVRTTRWYILPGRSYHRHSERQRGHGIARKDARIFE